jgi:integrase
MGLGPYPAVSLANARAAASRARSLVKQGRDPIDARAAEKAHALTFDEAAQLFIESNEKAWRATSHRLQWRVSLATYASPVIGAMQLKDIGLPQIKAILEPLWFEKPETAFRLRGRIERILDWATVSGHRTGENTARWRGHLDKVLPALSQVRKVKHFAAVPIDEVATIYDRLRSSKAISALGLRFIILTAARAGEVAGMIWDEIDVVTGVWTVPADRTKTGRPHRVPLSDEAISILETAREAATGNLVFPGWAKGKPLALKSFRRVLKAAGGGSATVHGFRSSFRDWIVSRSVV